MTADDILNKKFDRATVGGLRADDVNAFMVSVADEIRQMEENRVDLQNKLIVLADKLEEYRSDEESMRAALLGAQKLGDTIVKDSKEKSEILLDNAVQEAENIVSKAKEDANKIREDARKQLEMDTIALQRMQREVSQFKTKILSMYQRQIDLIQTIPNEGKEIDSLPDPLVSNISKKRSDKKNSTVDIFENMEQIDMEDSQKERETFQKTDDNFQPLQFGDGFRLAKDK